MKNIIPILLITVLFTSCTKEIEIDIKETSTLLVVEGQVTTDTVSHWVRLSKSRAYSLTNPFAPVTNAVIKIDDGLNPAHILTENTTEPGLYETAPDYFGISGRVYKLEIKLAEKISGRDHFTASSELLPLSLIDSIRIDSVDNWSHPWEIQIFAMEPPTIDYYSFSIMKNGILLTDSIDELQITDDRFFNGAYANGISVYFIDGNNPNEVPNNGDTITLVVGRITKDYYGFVDELQRKSVEFWDPLSGGSPANISTNLSEGAIGFFTACSNSYSSTVYIEE